MSGSTNLLEAWEQKEEEADGPFRVVRISVGGDPHVRAVLNAVIDHYNFLAERPRPREEDLNLLVGSKVTLVRTGENMFGGGILQAQEGKLFATPSGFGILPPRARTKGFRVRVESLLDIFPGYVTEEAAETVRQVRAHFPTVRPVTQERLKELPTNSETLSLCMFGTYQVAGERATDALYLASEYWPNDDIVEGVLLIRENVGTSENGSCYGQQFLRGDFGEVVGFTPISFAEGIHLCNLPFAEAYAQVIGSLAPPAETCPECGQPDNCGDCTHQRVTS